VFDIVFWILAVLAVISALSVLVIRDVFRAAMALIFLFMVIAAIYVTLSADFLAIVQILVYVGAISILIIVGIMLTRDVAKGNPSGKFVAPAIVAGMLLLIVLVFAITNTAWTLNPNPPLEPTAQPLGKLLFGEGGYLFPVEMVAVLLFTAVLGAIVLLREK
jgi:NADH-quinone oxidoreductase subunit J